MLTPSNSPLWVPCSLAGHVLASGEYHATPQPNDGEISDSRREGICAHWAAELLIHEQVDAPRELIGMQHQNGWRIDHEMAHHAAAFVEYCRSFGPVTAAEVPVNLFGGLVRGRLDAASTFGEVGRVFDFKYGWQTVEARQNWPMLCYGLFEVADHPGRDLELHIFQPRPHHPDGPARVWHIPAADVPSWSEWLYVVACEARDNPRASVGPQCVRCPAQAGCVANARTSYELFAALDERRQHEHTASELAAELAFLDLAGEVIKSRRKGVYAEAYARLRRGDFLPGLALKPTIGDRVFTVPADKIELATGREATKPKLKTPAELEREGVPRPVLDLITDRPTTGFKITTNTEELANQLFGKIK